MFRGRVRHAHFIGIGGIGMSGLAEILRTMRFDVSGSDMKKGDVTRRLESLGVRVLEGHTAENVRGADVVVYTSAVKADNPEMVAAQALGIPTISRAEMLAELMRTKYGIAIAGSHGKTTTTSLVAMILRAGGLDPTVVVGGKVNALGSNATLGEGDLFVAEADESDGSFLKFTPTIAVVTNIDAEHLDHYGSHENVKEAFVTFVNRTPFYGLAVLCVDHPHVHAILPQVARRYVTYGLSKQADYRAKNLRFEGLVTRFDAYKQGEKLGEFVVRMPGEHNVLNALAAVAVADELEVPLNITRDALANFVGVQRRFTTVANVQIARNGVKGEVALVDDYGHHPAEVQATLRAAQNGFPDARVVVAFQPHRYTRTRDLFEEFALSFHNADVVLVTNVYAAGEEPIEGASAEALVAAIREHGHHDVRLCADKTLLPEQLEALVLPGDIVIALGAGDINACLLPLKARLESAKV